MPRAAKRTWSRSIRNTATRRTGRIRREAIPDRRGDQDVVEYVLKIGGQQADAAKAARGDALFHDGTKGNCNDCHENDGVGNLALGSTNLTAPNLYLYGADRAAITESIVRGRARHDARVRRPAEAGGDQGGRDLHLLPRASAAIVPHDSRSPCDDGRCRKLSRVRHRPFNSCTPMLCRTSSSRPPPICFLHRNWRRCFRIPIQSSPWRRWMAGLSATSTARL